MVKIKKDHFRNPDVAGLICPNLLPISLGMEERDREALGSDPVEAYLERVGANCADLSFREQMDILREMVLRLGYYVREVESLGLPRDGQRN